MWVYSSATNEFAFSALGTPEILGRPKISEKSQNFILLLASIRYL
jgi:hypothetical protein